MQNFGRWASRERIGVFRLIHVIARSEATRQSILLHEERTGLLRFACNHGLFPAGGRLLNPGPFNFAIEAMLTLIFLPLSPPSNVAANHPLGDHGGNLIR